MAGPFQGSDLNPALNKSGQTGNSPREYNQHQRYSKLSRRRHDGTDLDDQLFSFLSMIVTKLGGGAVTIATVFAKVTKYGAQRVKAATNISQLP